MVLFVLFLCCFLVVLSIFFKLLFYFILFYRVILTLIFRFLLEKKLRKKVVQFRWFVFCPLCFFICFYLVFCCFCLCFMFLVCCMLFWCCFTVAYIQNNTHWNKATTLNYKNESRTAYCKFFQNIYLAYWQLLETTILLC